MRPHSVHGAALANRRRSTSLGFTHICGRTRKGAFQLKRKSRSDRMRAKLRAIKEKNCGDACMTLSSSRDTGCASWCAATLPTTRCPPTSRASSAFRQHVVDLWRRALNVAAARRTAPPGLGSLLLRPSSCPLRASFIRGRTRALPSLTQGGSPVRKSRPPGSVRGVSGNGHPCRDDSAAGILRRLVASFVLGTASLVAPTHADPPPTVPRIRRPQRPGAFPTLEEGLRSGLRGLGYTEGADLVIDWPESVSRQRKPNADSRC